MEKLKLLLKILIIGTLAWTHSTWAKNNELNSPPQVGGQHEHISAVNMDSQFNVDIHVLPEGNGADAFERTTINTDIMPNENTPVGPPIGLEWLENFLTENGLMNDGIQAQINRLRGLIREAFGWIGFEQDRQQIWDAITDSDDADFPPMPTLTIYTQVLNQLNPGTLNNLRQNIINALGSEEEDLENFNNLIGQMDLLHDGQWTEEQHAQINLAGMMLTAITTELTDYLELITPNDDGTIELLTLANNLGVEHAFFETLANILLRVFDPNDIPNDYAILFGDNEEENEEMDMDVTAQQLQTFLNNLGIPTNGTQEQFNNAILERLGSGFNPEQEEDDEDNTGPGVTFRFTFGGPGGSSGSGSGSVT